MAKRLNGEGSIYQDGNRWVAAVKIGILPTGKPLVKRRKCATKTEATAVLRELHAAREAGRLISTKRQSLSGFIDDWLENKVKPNRQPSTYRQYEWIVRFHLKPFFGNSSIANITRQDIQSLIATKSKQPIAQRGVATVKSPESTLGSYTLRNIRAVLHAAFEEARRSGLIAVNPVDLVEIPKKARLEAVNWLPAEQAKELLRAIQGKELGELFAFMLHTGTRIGEATGLRWADVKLGKNPTATISGQLQRVKGNGLQRRAGTKTNQLRTLALTDTIATMLGRIRQCQVDESNLDAEGIVFRTMEGKRVDARHANKLLRGYCKQAGVPEVSPHKLRHTAASLMLAATGDLHAVQKILGHSQVALTANLYGHANAETLRPTVEKLEALYRD